MACEETRLAPANGGAPCNGVLPWKVKWPQGGPRARCYRSVGPPWGHSREQRSTRWGGALGTVAAMGVRSIVFAGVTLLACCNDNTPGSGATTGATATVATARASGAPSARSSGAAEVPSDHVELQKFVLTSGVKAKDPVDVLDSAKAGQRVYGHVTVRNRTAGSKRVSLSFRVNGDERTMVDLDIEKSWSWRSWAYVTLRKDDKGEVTVHVFDDHGAELATESIPIR